MILALRHRIVAILLGVLACLPASVDAGMTAEEVKAFEGFRAKAEKGDALAQFETGCCYDAGVGVPKDLVEAVRWYHKAAEQGDNLAQ